MRRDHWKRRNDALAPATDFVEIYRTVVTLEFAWDMNQALLLLETPTRKGFDDHARRVADATLALLVTYHPRAPKRAVAVFSKALMDDPLLRAFRYEKPAASVVAASRRALRLRGRIAGLLPAKRTATHVADLPWVRSYPDGYRVEDLGTFPDTDAAMRHRSATA